MRLNQSVFIWQLCYYARIKYDSCFNSTMVAGRCLRWLPNSVRNWRLRRADTVFGSSTCRQIVKVIVMMNGPSILLPLRDSLSRGSQSKRDSCTCSIPALSRSSSVRALLSAVAILCLTEGDMIGAWLALKGSAADLPSQLIKPSYSKRWAKWEAEQPLPQCRWCAIAWDSDFEIYRARQNGEVQNCQHSACPNVHTRTSLMHHSKNVTKGSVAQSRPMGSTSETWNLEFWSKRGHHHVQTCHFESAQFRHPRPVLRSSYTGNGGIILAQEATIAAQQDGRVGKLK